MTNFDQYQKSIKETSYWPEELGLLYLSNALGGEAGELQNIIKKVYRDHDGEPYELHRDQLISELGDVLWYVAAIASKLQIKLSEVAYQNRLKSIQKKAKSKIKQNNISYNSIEPLDRNGGVG